MPAGLLANWNAFVELDRFEVKRIRKWRGLTTETLAEKSGVSKRTIENWEGNGPNHAKIDKLRAVATALDVDPEELLTAEFRRKLQKRGQQPEKPDHPDAPPPQPPAKPFNLPASIGNLLKGREEFLKDLRQKLLSGIKAAAIFPIHGLGGVGKTRVAVEYAWRHKDDYTALLYVYADSPETLLTNLAGLAGVLALPERELREDELRAAAVVRWLSAHRDWLLLIDNVDTEAAAKAVADRLDKVHGGHVVITSRIGRWPDHFEPLELGVLDAADAADYLLQAARNRAPSPLAPGRSGVGGEGAADREQALRIAQDVDGLALALTQAAGYVDKYRISFAEYRKRWQENVAAVAAWHDPRTMSYPKSLAVTWSTTVERLTPAAKTLLELLSFLAPEPIPRDLVTGETSKEPLAKSGIGEPSPVTGRLTTAEDALVELADVSMARVTGGTVTLHRLVMEITRSQIADASRTSRLDTILAVVNGYPFGDPTDVRTWSRWIPMAEHVAALVDRADAAKIAQPTSRLMNELGLFLEDRIRFREAERLYRRALAIDEQSFGPEHPKVAIRLNNLAGLLQATNRLPEAEPLMRRALAIDEQGFGPEHPRVGIELNNLAQLLQDTNRLTEAEPLMRRALAIDEQRFGPEHPKVAISLNNLAQLLQDTNRLPEAEPLMRRALAIDEQSFGPEHPRVAIALNNLAQLLQATNRLAEAEPLMRRALAIDEQSFGPEHPRVAIDLNNLATLLKATNRLTEAEPLMRRHLEIFVAFHRQTGHEHPHFRAAIANYKHLLAAMGRNKPEIEAAVRQVLDGSPDAK